MSLGMQERGREKAQCLCLCPDLFVLQAAVCRGRKGFGGCGNLWESGDAAAWPGAINSTLRSLSRRNALGLGHWGAEAI